MEGQMVTQGVLVSQDALDPNQVPQRFALFNEDGEAIAFSPVNPTTGQDVVYSLITTGTAAGTAAKTTTSAEPVDNTIVPIKFTSGNTAASPTVAFNGGAARAVNLGGVAPTAAEIAVGANGVVLFWFDGTILHQLGVVS